MSGDAPAPIGDPDAAGSAKRYGLTAGMLTVALAVAGLLTYGFFAFASHSLSADDYGLIVVLWTAVFIVVSTVFRPVEQLVSRTVAELDAHGSPTARALRIAGAIQFGLALAFVAIAFILRGPIQDDLLEGQAFLFYVMVGSVTAFAASLFARGYLAGSRQFGLFSALLLLDSGGRLALSLAVAIGIAEGTDAVALGIVAGPTLSLLVVPFAIRSRHRRPPPSVPGSDGPASLRPEVPEMTLAHGGGFAAAVFVVMLSEQVFLNGGPLFARAEAGTAAAGFIFNMLMVARAPVVLFQAVAASLLPHLTRLRSTGDETSDEAFRLSVRLTITVIAGLATAAVVVMLAARAGADADRVRRRVRLRPDGAGDRRRRDGALPLGRDPEPGGAGAGQARRAAMCWAACAVGFIVWNLIGPLDVFRTVEVGFTASAAVLCALLYLVYRRPDARTGYEVTPGSTRELEARLAAADEVS